MSNSDEIRNRLLARQRELETSVNRFSDAARESSVADVQDEMDQVTSSEAKTASLDISTREFRALENVEDALRRLDEGTYGKCVVCGAEIPEARLQALPETRYCVRHAEEADQAANTIEQPFLGSS